MNGIAATIVTKHLKPKNAKNNNKIKKKLIKKINKY